MSDRTREGWYPWAAMRIGLLADGHGNVEAFDRGLHALREAGAERFYFLGDAVGYLPGAGILARLREWTGGGLDHDDVTLIAIKLS